MSVRMRVLVGMLLMSVVATVAPAQNPTPAKAPSLAELDKIAVDILKDVHNRGAVLNNNGNPDGCYFMYEGGLRTVKPFLAHRPAIQKIIDAGFEEVAKSEGMKIKAFRLHEIIEQVRAELKIELKKAAETPVPAPMPVAPMPKPKEPTPVAPMPMSKPKEPTPVPAPMPSPKPKEPTPVVKPKDPLPSATEGDVKGTLTLDGQPLGGAMLTIVTTDKPLPRVLSVRVKPDGTYQFEKPLPPGEYAMMVTHENGKVPERYQTTLTSGLRFSVRAGANTMDLKLVGK